MSGRIGPGWLAWRLRVARARREISIEALARAVGVSGSSIANWEANRSSPPGTLHNRLAGALNVHRAWLLSGEGPDPFPIAPRDDPRSVAARLHAARNALGMTVAMLSEEADVAPEKIEAWEQGREEPLPHDVRALARALRVRPQWLAGRSDHGGLIPIAPGHGRITS